MGRDRKPREQVYADPAGKAPAKRPDLNRVRTALVILTVVLALLAAGTTATVLLHRLQSRYEEAMTLLARRDYAAAQAGFDALGNYRDSRARAEELGRQAAAYADAQSLAGQQRFDEATAAFRALGDYADSPEQAAFGMTYRKALALLEETEAGDANLLGRILSPDATLTDENGYPAVVGYQTAAALFDSLGDYADAPQLAGRCRLSAARVCLRWQDWEGALACRAQMDPDTAALFDTEYEAARAEAEAES